MQSIPYDSAVAPLTDQEFALFQSFIYQEMGISLGANKKALVFGRLSKRLRELGLRSFTLYYRKISGRDADLAERSYMFDCICTNETHFFRDPRHFEFLQTKVFSEWQYQASVGDRPKRIRAWSAACSTGEEPFTLAMLLHHHFPSESGWQVEILATDLSNKALSKAKEAVWPIERASEIADVYLKKYMLRGTGQQQGKMKAGPELRTLVDFQRLNLNDEQYDVQGTFDVIFCRNVMIYFDQASKTRVVNHLIRHLSSSGYFFLGSAESLNGINDHLKNVHPSIYRNPSS